MSKKPEKIFLEKIIRKVAPKIGASVLSEPKWGIVFQVTFKNGKRKYSRFNSVDLNPLGSSEVARDKDYANFFMKGMGYPTIEGKAFCSPVWAKTIKSKDDINAAFKYAKSLGFPVIVKPNSGSQGVDVALVYSRETFFKAMNKIFKNDRMALVQRKVTGKDYRMVVLDNKIISAYERIPLSVVGDGKLSIKKLLEKKKKYFKKIKRDINIDVSDPRIKSKLKFLGKNINSIPKKDEKVFLLDNANLSSGGDSVDVTNSIHKDFKKIATKLTKDMGLRICGVDLMIDGDIADKPKKYWVIEVNSAPGLDHYVTTGKAQEKIVEDMYLEVLKSMQK
jgi:D-alanine-D-alanine ligase-like ATP-grasp enzyme